MNESGSRPSSSPARTAAAALPSDGVDERHPVRFDGRGIGLCKVWAINGVLLLVTLGLYAPWARRRALRWYRRHTFFAGSPLDEAGPPRWRPWDLAGLVAAFAWLDHRPLGRSIGALADQVGLSVLTAVAAVACGGIVLMCRVEATRVRLASVRWRGLQVRFEGRVADLVRGSWPATVVAALGAAMGVWIALMAYSAGIDDPDAHESAARAAGLGFAAAIGLSLWLSPFAAPLLLLQRVLGDRLAFEHAVVGATPVRFLPTAGTYVAAAFGAVLVLVAGVIAVLGLAAVSMPPVPDLGILSVPIHPDDIRTRDAMFAAYRRQEALHEAGLMLRNLALASVVPIALGWFEAKVFAATWNGAVLGESAGCRCTLSPAAFVRSRVSNVLLTVATLGLYLPFARVREYRAKAESVTMRVAGGLDAFVAVAVAGGPGARAGAVPDGDRGAASSA